MLEYDDPDTRARHVLDFLASAGPHANAVEGKWTVRAVMLRSGGSIMSGGKLYDIITKNLGAGVYKLMLKIPV